MTTAQKKDRIAHIVGVVLLLLLTHLLAIQEGYWQGQDDCRRGAPQQEEK